MRLSFSIQAFEFAFVEEKVTNLCISAAELLIPRQRRTTNPVTAIDTRNRVRVNKIRTARHGGNLDRADFQLTPPLGSNILQIF
jgi:hypothetical protein